MEGDETLYSSILGFTAIWDAGQGQRFPRGFIVSCHKKSDAFNCYRQKCILGTPSMTFGVTPVINLAWLTCSWVARLIIAKVLISQRRENCIGCSSVQGPRLGVYSGNETLWKASLQLHCILISVITKCSPHLEIIYWVTKIMIKGYCSPLYDRLCSLCPVLLYCYVEIESVDLNLLKFTIKTLNIYF